MSIYARVSQTFCSSVPLDNLWIYSSTPKNDEDQTKGLCDHRAQFPRQKSVKTTKKKSSRPQGPAFPSKIDENQKKLQI